MHKKISFFYILYFRCRSPNIFFGTELTQQAIKQSKNTTSKAFFKVGTMHEVESVIKNRVEDINTNEVLLAFDVDMTLIHPAHRQHILSLLLNTVTNIRLFGKIFKGSTKNGLYAHEQPSARACRNRSVKNGRACQLKGIKTIAFTATFTGKLGEIQSVEESRYKQLKTLDSILAKALKTTPM
jgi:hypothetical protein